MSLEPTCLHENSAVLETLLSKIFTYLCPLLLIGLQNPINAPGSNIDISNIA
jgi:hypothetical protein